ncbi:MAG TPA: hypothetical protein VHC47_06815 [Mucilaginibacter sp.]|nr:hypothetical protein [Mucilaginibacter sp.]
MKEALKYRKLWQLKRSEWKIDEDPQNDWMAMRDLLDKQLPVETTGRGPKPSSYKGPGLISSLLIILSAAAMSYIVYRLTQKTVHKEHVVKTRPVKIKNYSGRDTLLSLPGNAAASQVKWRDSLNEMHRMSDQSLPDSSNVMRTAAHGKNLQPNSPAAGPQALPRQKGHSQDRVVKVYASQSASKTGYSWVGGYNRLSGAILKKGLTARGIASAGYYLPQSGRNPKISNLVDHNSENYRYLIELSPPSIGLNNSIGIITPQYKMILFPVPEKLNKWKSKSGSASVQRIEWGILTGFNARNSLNIPGDLYYGPYVTYHLGNKLSLNLQVKLLSSEPISGSYIRPNGSRIDTNQKTFRINDSRKVYSLQAPLYVQYALTPYLSLKAGPVFGIPLKQSDGRNSLVPDSIRTDTSYYPGIAGALSKTKYRQTPAYGISLGAAFNLGRFSFETVYLKQLNKQVVGSTLGNYKYSDRAFQFTVGFRLNKLKNKKKSVTNH